MNNRIAYMDIINEEPVLSTKNNVAIGTVDFVSLFKTKYNKEEIRNEQLIIKRNLDEIIRTVKKILIRLSDYKLTLEMEDNEFEEVFIKKVIIEESEIEEFCNAVGRKITSTFSLPNIEACSTISSDEILYLFLE